MASPKIIAPIPSPADKGRSVTSPAPASSDAPAVPIPNIPPRSSASSAGPRSFSRSFTPLSGTRSSSNSKQSGHPTPKASNDDLGRKASPTPVNVASALTAQLGHSQSPASTPLSRNESAVLIRNDSGTNTPRNNESAFSNVIDVDASEEAKAKVLRRHLVSADERSPRPSMSANDPPQLDLTGQSAVASGSGTSGVQRAEGSGYGSTEDLDADLENFPIPYDAPGGDVTHDLYKWQHDHRPGRPNRSASFSHVPLDRSAIFDPTLAHIKEPGGFRRNFVVNRAQEQGLEAPTVVRNVIDFLFLYGHFAGEDLDEDDDDDEEDEDAQYLSPSAAEAGRNPYAHEPLPRDALDRPITGERAPLLRRQTTRGHSRHRRTRSGPPVGTASVTQATLMLLKGFVGTGILFMGKAFFNGGLIFSAVVMLFIAAISLYCFLLLTKTYLVVPGSFGDIGGMLYGNYMRLIILTSIAVSQIGFVAAYTIFIAENLQAFVLGVTDCKTYIATRYLIFAELIIFLPLAMIRNLAKLSGTALVADAFILIGLIYIGVNETTVLAKRGLADVMFFNKQSFPLLIGTAVFAFEGIGLVIPITESMREPHKFPPVLSGVMLVVALLFTGFGTLGYAAYGSDIQTVVIVNLPQDDKFVQAVQFLYSIAILLSIPLQLFPAVRIMENGLFSKSGKHNPSVKWQKNVFRAGTVLFCTLLSWAGSKELDKFVALIGSFACIPLCFIYPPLLHLKACAKTRKAKVIDYTILAFGICVGLFTTVQTVRSLFQPSDGGGTQFGKCKVPN